MYLCMIESCETCLMLLTFCWLRAASAQCPLPSATYNCIVELREVSPSRIFYQLRFFPVISDFEIQCRGSSFS